MEEMKTFSQVKLPLQPEKTWTKIKIKIMSQASLEEWEIVGPTKGERAANVISRIKVRYAFKLIGELWELWRPLTTLFASRICWYLRPSAAIVPLGWWRRQRWGPQQKWLSESTETPTLPSLGAKDHNSSKVRVTNTVSSLEVGSWRPSLGLALKVPFLRTSTLIWEN